MAVSLEAELDSFKIDFINRNKGKSPITPYLYAGDIKNLSTKQTYESPEELAGDLIKSIDRIKQDINYKPRTKNRFFSSCTNFFVFILCVYHIHNKRNYTRKKKILSIRVEFNN